SLDTTFGGVGYVTTDFGTGSDHANGVAIQADGKIVVVGHMNNGTNDDFAVARYNIDGSLDTTFDGDGMVTTDLFASQDRARDVDIQSDGKIIVVGQEGPSATRDFALARYNTDGSLDTSFDTDGKVTTDFFGFGDQGREIAIQSDGKIVLVGRIHNGVNEDFGVARYNTDGSLDTTFDGDGRVTTDINGEDRGEAVSLQTDGKIIAAGNTNFAINGDFALVRYNTDGSLDTSFDGDGIATIDVGGLSDDGEAVAVQPDGKIVIVGHAMNATDDDVALARYNPDGSLDNAGCSVVVVNSTGDGTDFNPGDDTCETGSGNAICTLRAAIVEANVSATIDTIRFNIPTSDPNYNLTGNGEFTIRPTSPLPSISNPVTIDGYTQPGAQANSVASPGATNAVLLIEIDGTSAGIGVDGLDITAGSSTVRGLVINRFNRGILIQSNSNTVAGNYIGTDVTGTLDRGNTGSGVRVSISNSNNIGGPVAADRNVISGNDEEGITITGVATGNTVRGNYIGTNAGGNADLGNTWEGIQLWSAAATNSLLDNVISGNDRAGIRADGASTTGNIIRGNYIGTDAAGTGPLGNTLAGVDFYSGTANNTIGGTAGGEDNLIANNGGDGINLDPTAGTGNAILRNRIFANTGLGIDLSNDGVTANDANDLDTGPNNLMNFPVIYSAIISGSNITVTGEARPGATVEFFEADGDISGYGEGQTFVASKVEGSADDTNSAVGTNDATANQFTFTFPVGSLVVGDKLAATATDASGNTSEFALNFTTTGAGLLAHWSFDEGSGQTAGDSSGNGNDGTLGSTTAVEANDPDWTSCSSGGYALAFNGSEDDEVLLPGLVIGDRAAWTITAWIKTGNDTADDRTIYSEGDTALEEVLWLAVDQSGTFTKFWYENPQWTWTGNIDGTTNVEDEQWRLVTMVQRSKTDRELYVGTNSEGTNIENPGTLSFDTASIGFLRTIWTADPFLGLIDDVRIYDRALSTGEIGTLAASPPSGCAWADPNYQYRAQITVSAGSSAIPADYPTRFEFDHASLVTATKALASGDDVRIFYWDGSTNTELDRTLFDDGPAGAASSTWNSATTTLMFKTVESIKANGLDAGYYLYYGYSSAVSPPTNTPSSRYYRAQQLTEFTTTDQVTYQDTGASLTFTPSDVSEQWVVVATWRQRDTRAAGSTEVLGEARVRVNSVVRIGTDDIAYKQSGNAYISSGAMFKITGTTSPQTIDVQFRAVGGSFNDGIDDIRILAFMIPDPANANIQYAESLATVNDISATPVDALQISFAPSSGGNYIWMGNGFHHENPGGASTEGLHLDDETDTTQQESDETYSNQAPSPMNGYVNLMHFEERNLTIGPKTFTFRHLPDPTGSERRGLSMLLFRSDVFEGVETVDDATLTITANTSPQTKVSLTTATQASERDYIYLAVMMHDDGGTGDGLAGPSYADIRHAGNPMMSVEMRIDRGGYDTNIQWASAEYTTGNQTIVGRYWSSGATVDARADYAHILALRYKEPGTTLGPEE
ncbi:MAG: LamG-like jellyroll fold domain-containing protein, partial [Anaerolineales bacterium]